MKIFLLAFCAVLLQGITIAQVKPLKSDKCLEHLIKNAKSELSKEEAQIMQEFFNLTGINPNQWEKLKNGCKPELLNEDRAYLKKIVRFCQIIF